MREQVRVQWSIESVDISWEDKAALQARFPRAEAWRQPSSKGKVGVSDPDRTTPPVRGSKAMNGAAHPHAQEQPALPRPRMGAQGRTSYEEYLSMRPHSSRVSRGSGRQTRRLPSYFPIFFFPKTIPNSCNSSDRHYRRVID
jgi:hypothetical protein